MPPEPPQPPTDQPTKPALVVGLDTAANRWHAVASNGMCGQCGPLKNKAWDNPDARRQKLYNEARTFFAFLPNGSHIFCEEPLALQNGKTTRQLGLAAGAIWAAHMEYDLFWYWVNVESWKEKVIGKGAASKQLIQEHLKKAGIEYPEEDLYDAHAIRRYGEIELEAQGIAILN